MKQEIYKFLVWVILALIFLSSLFIFPKILKINPIVKYVGTFMLGILYTVLSEFIVNKFNKK